MYKHLTFAENLRITYRGKIANSLFVAAVLSKAFTLDEEERALYLDKFSKAPLMQPIDQEFLKEASQNLDKLRYIKDNSAVYDD